MIITSITFTRILFFFSFPFVFENSGFVRPCFSLLNIFIAFFFPFFFSFGFACFFGLVWLCCFSMPNTGDESYGRHNQSHTINDIFITTTKMERKKKRMILRGREGKKKKERDKKNRKGEE